MKTPFLLVPLLCACGASATAPSATHGAQAQRGAVESDPECEQGDGACAQAALLAADDALQADLRSRGLAAAFTAALDEDSSFVTTFQPLLTGKPAIAAYLAAAFPDPAATALSWIRARGDVSARGDLGYTFGWTLFTRGAGAPAPGHYMAVWRREHKPGGAVWTLESFLRHGSRPRTPPPAWFGPVPPGDDEGDPVDQQEELQRLEAIDAQFAALSATQGQPVAHQRFAAPDAVELLSDATFGRDAIVASHVHDQGSLNWWPTGGGVAGSGDLGYTIGRYVYTDRSVSPSVDYPGHYLTIWKRQPDGQWKYVVGAGAYSPIP